MDGVSIGASLIGILGFALSSIKVVYSTISEIRDGPKIVADAASALSDLQSFLGQLVRLTPRLTDIGDLQILISKCASDLESLQIKVEALLVLPSEKKLGKIWKRVKTMLKEEDFRRIWIIIRQHHSALSSQLQTLNCDMNLLLWNGLEQIDSTLRNNVLHIPTRLNDTHDSIKRLEELSNQQAKKDMVNAEKLKETLDTVSQVNENMQNFNIDSASSHENTRQEIAQLSTRMTEFSGMSVAQFESLIFKIEKLEHQIMTQANHGPLKSSVIEMSANPDELGTKLATRDAPADEVREANQIPKANESESDLKASLQRLCRLADEKEKSTFSTEAQGIIDDVDKMLDAVHHEVPTPNHKLNKHKRKRMVAEANIDSSDSEDLKRKHEIKRVRAVLGASQSIIVNGRASRQTAVYGPNYKRNVFHRACRIAGGTITVRLDKRTLERSMNDGDDQGEDIPTKEIEVFEAVTSFVPDTVPSIKVSVMCQQRLTYQGSFLQNPALTFSAVLPNDSEVFLAIKAGDIDKLLQLLTDHKASLSDCDSYGRPLLYYAYRSLDYPICKLLIDSGVDVDLSVYEEEYEPHTMLLNTYPHNDCEADPDQLSESLACRQLFLQANADPTLVDDGANLSYFSNLIDVGTLESTRLVLDLSGHFINLNERDEEGTDSLMLLLEIGPRCGFVDFTRRVELLLHRGACPTNQDDWGNTCLHLCLRLVSGELCLESMIILIKGGADVHAVNNCGESVTELAYRTIKGGDRLCCKARRNRVRGNRGLLWERALEACGYDAISFRQDFIDSGGDILEHTDLHKYLKYWRHKVIKDGEDCVLEDLIYMITAGADVGALDGHGKTPTDVAYAKSHKGLSNLICGKIWEQALEACGYNAQKFRQNFVDSGGHLPVDLSDLGLFSHSEEATDMDLDYKSTSGQCEGSTCILDNKEQTSSHDQSKTISPTIQENVNPGASLHVNDPQATDVLSPINPTWTLSDSATDNRSSSQPNTFFPPWSAAPDQNFPREFFSGDEPSLWGVEDQSHVESCDYLTESRLVGQNVAPSQDEWSTYILDSRMPRMDLGQSSRVWDLEDWEAEPNVWADEGR